MKNTKKESEVIRILMDLLLYHWKTRKRVLIYFFFQILYNELMDCYLPDKRCPVVSDFIPHFVQAKILDPSALPRKSFGDILQKNNMHKMTYFKGDAADRFISFVKEFTDLQ